MGTQGSHSVSKYQRQDRILVLLLIAAILVSRLFAPSVLVESAIERAESYAGICLAIDDECSYTAHGEINLGTDQAKDLNLLSHWLSTTPAESFGIGGKMSAPTFVSQLCKQMPTWLLPANIFHPPKEKSPV